MAKLKNLHAFKRNWTAHNMEVTVGNNRVAQRISGGAGKKEHKTVFKLHGSILVQAIWNDLHGLLVVHVTDAGYPTSTTREAIKDFLRGLGVTHAKVSMAGGELSIKVVDTFGHERDNVKCDSLGGYEWATSYVQLEPASK